MAESYSARTAGIEVSADELTKCPRCWQTAVNTTDPGRYKYRICQGCGHQLADGE